jgi:hypothetical protein
MKTRHLFFAFFLCCTIVAKGQSPVITQENREVCPTREGWQQFYNYDAHLMQPVIG